MKLLLWVILFAISWPLALLFLVIYPLAWLVALPFRLLGKTVRGIVHLALDLLLLPVRLPMKLLRA